MICIVVGTNRVESNSSKIADLIQSILDNNGMKSKILNMTEMPKDLVSAQMFVSKNQHPKIKALQDEYISASSKFVFVIPEYNGSFPGILKLFIDAVSVRNYKTNFLDKKALIIGLASGRLGNAIGASHLNAILNYMGMHTYPEKMYIAAIDGKFKNDEFNNQAEINLLNTLLMKFVNY